MPMVTRWSISVLHHSSPEMHQRPRLRSLWPQGWGAGRGVQPPAQGPPLLSLGHNHNYTPALIPGAGLEYLLPELQEKVPEKLQPLAIHLSHTPEPD